MFCCTGFDFPETPLIFCIVRTIFSVKSRKSKRIDNGRWSASRKINVVIQMITTSSSQITTNGIIIRHVKQSLLLTLLTLTPNEKENALILPDDIINVVIHPDITVSDGTADVVDVVYVNIVT